MTERAYSLVFPECVPSIPADEPAIRAVRMSGSILELDLASGYLPEAWLSEAKKLLCEFYGVEDIKFGFDKGMNNPPQQAKPTRNTKNKAPVPQDRNTKSIYGTPSRMDKMSIDIVPHEEAKVCVAGKVFRVDDVFERRGKVNNRWGNYVRLEFYISDGTGALRVSIAVDKAEYDPKLHAKLAQLMEDGEWVCAQGQMIAVPHMDTEEWILSAKCLLPDKTPSRRHDTADTKRVELHLHTQMSEKDATTSVSEAIATAARWGHRAIAITDHGVVHSFPEAMKAGKKHGIKVIYGVEGYLIEQEGSKERYHIILLAKNNAGLHNLYRIVSLSHVDFFKSRPCIPRELLTKYREGLIVGSACEAGDLFRALLRGESEEFLCNIASFYDYLEIQPTCNNNFLVRSGVVEGDEQLRDLNRAIVRIADKLMLPVCATGDVHFLEPEDEIYRKVLLASMDMDDGFPLPLYLKTTDEMLEEFSYLGSERSIDVVITQPNLLADQCEAVKPVRSGEFFPKIEGSASELEYLTLKRAHELYGEKLPEILEERINIELGSIIKKGYDIIYIIAQKLVHQSVRDGYLVGSRGSVGSSIVAYLAGITEVNALPPHYRCPECKYSEFPSELHGSACGPDMRDEVCPNCGIPLIKDGFDIPFATFLGFEADKKPDIDLNFSSDYQSRAHAQTVEIFGADKVFRAGTITTLADKNTQGYAKGYFEKNFIPAQDADIKYYASGCVGVKTTTGQHPGGLIIVPQGNEIYEFCPVQYSANKKTGMVCTHFDYHAIEENLLKLDLLGHDCPTYIKHLETLTGLSYDNIPLDSREVMSIFSSSEALGYSNDKLLGPTGAVAIPEFGTRFVRGMLQKTTPTTFDELIRISGLSHGTDVWRGNAEELVDNKIATLRNIICARDDVTLFLIHKGLDKKLSFDISESVRKGKGLKPEWEREMRERGVPEWYITSAKKIKYMFPKAHAVAYVIMSFRIAWFKLFRPLEFYATYFTLNAGSFDASICFYSPQKIRGYIQQLDSDKSLKDSERDKIVVHEVIYEMLLRGFKFAPFSVDTADATRFKPGPDGLTLPLLVVPGLGDGAAQRIVQARETEPFKAQDDLLTRAKISVKNLETLQKLGAVSHLPESTQISFL